MTDFEKEDEQKELWKYSDGFLKEKNAKSEGEKEELSNYKPSSKEKEKDNVPRLLKELSNSYGDISFGVNKQNELIMVTSQKQDKGAVTLRNKSKKFDAASGKESLRHKGGSRGNFRVNSTGENKSALEFRQKNDKDAVNMANRMKELQKSGTTSVFERISPFFSSEKEKNELEKLSKPQNRGNSKVEAKIAHLNKKINEKEQLRVRTEKSFREVVKKARNFEGSSDSYFINLQVKKKKPKDDGKDDEDSKDSKI